MYLLYSSRNIKFSSMRIRKIRFSTSSFPLSNGLYAIFSFSWFKNSSSNEGESTILAMGI